MAQLSEYVSVSEAARLSGLSTRTLKRMADEGRIKFSRTPGGHVRIAREQLASESLLRPSANSPAPASSVLQNRKERVEELVLENQELRAKRELDRLREEDAERERQSVEARRAEAATRELALQQARTERTRDAERRKRERREAEAARQQAEFERHWFRWAKDRLSILDWLSIEQRHTVMDEVSFEIRAHGPDDTDAMEQILGETIARVVTPWQAAREATAQRERLLEEALWPLTWATQQETGRAAADARAAMAALPLSAAEWEIRSTLSSAISPAVQAFQERIAKERRENIEAFTTLAKLVWGK